MNVVPRLLLCSVVAWSTLISVCSFWRGGAARVGLDVAAVPELEGQIERARLDMAKMDQQSRWADDRWRSRREIAGEVIGGRMGLFEAAARFRGLNTGRDGSRLPLPQDGDSYEEQCCRQVIDWVAAELETLSSEQAAHVTADLNAELQDCLRREGTVRLPW